MTPGQIGKVRAMLAKAGIATDEEKKAFVKMITNRTDSLSACTHEETKKIIKYLEGNSNQGTFKDTMNAAAEKQRSYIISMAHEMHWHHPGTRKIDMAKVDNWCLQYSGHGKTLDQIDAVYLPALVTQFKKVRDSFLRSM